MAETEERIRKLEQRLAHAEARIAALEAAQRIPPGFGMVGSRINSDGFIVPADYPPR